MSECHIYSQRIFLILTNILTLKSVKISKVRKPDYFNQLLTNAPILYPLEILENLEFSGIFKAYKMGALVRKSLNSPLFESLISEIYNVFFLLLLAVNVISNRTALIYFFM